MKKIKFTKLSPSKNITILVESSVSISKQMKIAEKIMDTSHIGGEQVGFLMPVTDSRADYRMRMMGGEFCGNATISLGAWAMFRENINAPVGYKKNYLLEISGAEKLVLCNVRKVEKGYKGTIEMPLPVNIEEREFIYRTKTYKLTVVEFKGISHIIFDESVYGEASEEAIEDMAEEWADEMPEAFGIMLWSFDEEEELEYIKPYVVVQNNGVWEGSCASGASAVGVYLATQDKDNYKGEICFLNNPYRLLIDVEVDIRGRAKKIHITGHVGVVATGIGIIE